MLPSEGDDGKSARCLGLSTFAGSIATNCWNPCNNLDHVASSATLGARLDQAEIDRLLMKPTGRKRLGKYVLLGRLGHGGMGKIYLAYMPGPAGIEKLLVIKRLHSHLTGDRVLVGNFLDEARLSMVLSHPNIVHTYDVGEVNGRYFMVMEYIDGQNLGVVLRTAKRSGRYPASHVWGGMFVSVLEALHAAHTAVDARGRALNIIHRDISPQNVLITYEGVPKLVDFGIAKAAMRINETDAGVLKGKYAYMSPEQCQSEQLDPRSDIFAAGIVLWECLAGRRLYKSDSVVKSVERILHEAPIPPTRVNADCDPELSKVVVKALQKRPRDRFSTAEEFRDALDEAVRRSHNYRASEARALMRDLFQDVMDHQRHILDACLSAAEAVGDAPHTDVPADIHHENDSDVHVPNLDMAGEIEPTTPSAHHPSPLITHEENASEEDLPKTKGARPSIHSHSIPDRQRPGPNDVTVATASAPQRKSRAPLYAAVLALLMLPVCGVAVAIALNQAGDSANGVAGAGIFEPAATPNRPTPNRPTPNRPAPTADAPPASDPPAAESPSSASPTPSAENRATTNSTPDSTASASGDDVKRAKSNAKAEGTPTAERAPNDRQKNGADTKSAPSDAKTIKADDRRNESRARSRRRTRSGRPRVAVRSKEPPAPEPKVEPKVEPVVERTPDPGTLTLDTIPWTRVFLGKKFLGNTPLVGVPIPAGRQILRLVNKDEGIDHRYEANVAPGKPFRARLGLK